jgi:glycosyltransferase involved in cell wall biosynthesis
MKVLHVVTSLDPVAGGVSEAVKTMIGALRLKGIRNEVVCLDKPNAPFINDLTFPIHLLGPAKSSWAYSSQLIKWLENNLLKYNKIIVHGLWQFPDFAVRRTVQNFLRRNDLNVPKVYLMPHGMLDPYFQTASTRKLKALRNLLYWKIIEGENIKCADGLLFTCKEELLLARKSFRPYLPTNEISIGLGISQPPPFTPVMLTAFRSRSRLKESDKFILFLGRINEKKGVDLLIQAYISNFISNNLPYLVIAGPGLETPYGKEIVDVAKASKAADSIVFTGMLHGNAKWGALNGCEAFLLPSHQENFGIAVVEALACRKPVLISDKVNIWREINASGAGIVKMDTREGVEELLQVWAQLSHPEKEKMQDNALACYNENFAIDEVAKKLVDVFQDVSFASK